MGEAQRVVVGRRFERLARPAALGTVRHARRRRDPRRQHQRADGRQRGGGQAAAALVERCAYAGPPRDETARREGFGEPTGVQADAADICKTDSGRGFQGESRGISQGTLRAGILVHYDFFWEQTWRRLTLLCRRPGRDDAWSPTTLGMSKRDLLKDVLAIFGELDSLIGFDTTDSCCVARSKTLAKLAIDWQDMLKKASNED